MSPLIGKFCGESIPKTFTSSANQIFLTFKSDTSKSCKGFLIQWDSAATGCGGTLTSTEGAIISPQYPEPYSRNTLCQWKVTVNPGSVIQIVFMDIYLEDVPKCTMDYVQVRNVFIVDKSKTDMCLSDI